MLTQLNRYVVYIKLPVYVGQYMASLFHADKKGIKVPECTELCACISNFLYEGEGESWDIKASVLSEVRYKAMIKEMTSAKEIKRTIVCGNRKLPILDSSDCLFPFYIPSYVWKNTGEKKTDDTFLITQKAAHKFRRISKLFFLQSLSSFLEQERNIKKNKREKFDKMSAIEKFMLYYDIDLDYCEAIYKFIRRGNNAFISF